MNKFFSAAVVSLGLITAPLSASALVIDINTYLTGNPVGSNVTVTTLTNYAEWSERGKLQFQIIR